MDGLHSSGSLSNEAPQAAPLDLPPKHLYTCTVGRNRSQARYCRLALLTPHPGRRCSVAFRLLQLQRRRSKAPDGDCWDQ